MKFGKMSGYTITRPKKGRKVVDVRAGKTARVVGIYKKTGSGGNDDAASGCKMGLTDVENRLLGLISKERKAAGKPVLKRDPGLDEIICWHVTQMSRKHFFSHTDGNGRRSEERARYYSGNSSVRCSEIINWWSGSPSGDVHYQAYRNSKGHHNAYMEKGIYNLGPTRHAGVATVIGSGPKGSVYDGKSGSYSGVFFCDKPLTLTINPFSEK